MRITILGLIITLLAGCANMTPTQKKVAWVAAGVVVTSVAISASDGDDNHTGERKVCKNTGSTIICRQISD